MWLLSRSSASLCGCWPVLQEAVGCSVGDTSSGGVIGLCAVRSYARLCSSGWFSGSDRILSPRRSSHGAACFRAGGCRQGPGNWICSFLDRSLYFWDWIDYRGRVLCTNVICTFIVTLSGEAKAALNLFGVTGPCWMLAQQRPRHCSALGFGHEDGTSLGCS